MDVEDGDEVALKRMSFADYSDHWHVGHELMGLFQGLAERGRVEPCNYILQLRSLQPIRLLDGTVCIATA